MFNQKIPNVPDERELTETKKKFSIIGFALASALVLTMGFQFGVQYLLPGLKLTGITGTMVCTAFMCLVAFPIGMFILSRAGKGETKFGQRRGFAVWAALLGVLVEVSIAGDLISSFFSGGATDSEPLSFEAWYEILLYIVIVGIISPVFEELFFRKYLTGILGTWGYVPAMIISALFYAVFRTDLLTALIAFVVGAVYSYTYLTTGKIRYPIFMHVFINLFFIVVPELSYSLLASGEEMQAFEEAFVAWGTSGYAEYEALAEVLTETPGILAGYFITSFVSLLELGLAVAGVVVLLFFKRKMKMEDGTKKLDPKYVGDTVFLAPGIITFIVIAIAMTAVNVYLN